MFDFLEKESLLLKQNNKLNFFIFRAINTSGKYIDITYPASYLSNDFLQNDAIKLEAEYDILSGKSIYLKPDLCSSFHDMISTALVFYCHKSIKSHESPTIYEKIIFDPRYLAQRTDQYLLKALQIDKLSFFAELEFYADLPTQISDQFYEDMIVALEQADIEVVLYREAAKKMLGIYSVGILKTADAIETTKYLLQKIGNHYHIDISFHSNQAANINLHHIIYQNNKSIFQLNSFFAPTDDVINYASGIFNNFAEIILLSGISQQNHNQLKKIYFASAEDLPVFKNHHNPKNNDLYISVTLPMAEANIYLMLLTLVCYGIEGIYQKIELDNLEAHQDHFSFTYNFNQQESPNKSIILNKVIDKNILDILKNQLGTN